MTKNIQIILKMLNKIFLPCHSYFFPRSTRILKRPNARQLHLGPRLTCGVCGYDFRTVHIVPGPFDEMQARSYTDEKLSRAAATMHFWPGGRAPIWLEAHLPLFDVLVWVTSLQISKYCGEQQAHQSVKNNSQSFVDLSLEWSK